MLKPCHRDVVCTYTQGWCVCIALLSQVFLLHIVRVCVMITSLHISGKVPVRLCHRYSLAVSELKHDNAGTSHLW